VDVSGLEDRLGRMEEKIERSVAAQHELAVLLKKNVETQEQQQQHLLLLASTPQTQPRDLAAEHPNPSSHSPPRPITHGAVDAGTDARGPSVAPVPQAPPVIDEGFMIRLMRLRPSAVLDALLPLGPAAYFDQVLTVCANTDSFIARCVGPLLARQLDAARGARMRGGAVLMDAAEAVRVSQLLCACAGIGTRAPALFEPLHAWCGLEPTSSEEAALLAFAYRACGGARAITAAIDALEGKSSGLSLLVAAFVLALDDAAFDVPGTTCLVFDSPVLSDVSLAAKDSGTEGVISIAHLVDSIRLPANKWQPAPVYAPAFILLSRENAFDALKELLTELAAASAPAAPWVDTPCDAGRLMLIHNVAAAQLARVLHLDVPSPLHEALDSLHPVCLDGAYARTADVDLVALCVRVTEAACAWADRNADVATLVLAAIFSLPPSARRAATSSFITGLSKLLRADLANVTTAVAAAFAQALTLFDAEAERIAIEDLHHELLIHCACDDAIPYSDASAEALRLLARVTDEHHRERCAADLFECTRHCTVRWLQFVLAAGVAHETALAILERGSDEAKETLFAAAAAVLEPDDPVANAVIDGAIAAVRDKARRVACAAIRCIASLLWAPAAIPLGPNGEALVAAKGVPSLPGTDEVAAALESSSDAILVRCGVDALMECGGAQGEVRVTKVLLRHPDSAARAEAARAMAKSAGVPLMALLLATNDVEECVRVEALAALSAIGLPRLEAALAGPQRRHVVAVIRAAEDHLKFDRSALLQQVAAFAGKLV
jgi:hypothetical protein